MSKLFTLNAAQQSSNWTWHRLGRCADTLEDAAAELQSVITVVEATSQPMSRRDPMRPHMDVIYKYAQDKSPFKPSMVPRVTPQQPGISPLLHCWCLQPITGSLVS